MKLRSIFFCLLSSFLLQPSAFSQGPLPPPGPPAPTMKTLDQVEARIPIDSVHTPGDANYSFVVNQPGSYYLTSNLDPATPSGINVTAAGVTIDLNGFQITGSGGPFAPGYGIEIQSVADGCTVKNGSISGFSTGVRSSFTPRYAHGCALIRLRVTNCAGGIIAGEGARIESCTAFDNKNNGIQLGDGSNIVDTVSYNNGELGILAGERCTITNCTVTANQNGGIAASDGSTLFHCTAGRNKSPFTPRAGIATGSGCSITACTVYNTQTSNDTPGPTTGAGILTASGSTVKDCTVMRNAGDGIAVGSTCTVAGNTSEDNGSNAVIAGIRGTGSDNRIIGNNTTHNGRGISVGGTGNLVDGNHVRDNSGPGIEVTTVNGRNVVIRNVAGSNVNSYTGIASGNQVGPIDTNFSSTNPFANFGN